MSRIDRCRYARARPCPRAARQTRGIRVHAIAAGPPSTRTASGTPGSTLLLEKTSREIPARELFAIDDVDAATAFPADDAARLGTGQHAWIWYEKCWHERR
ncbi:SDR family oxidoreductase [Bosea sp. TAF32]|uniref:SDR family oxidoreductase n=1 Tax=Bosea sp. TAF32 TaxID=3237482 RepID=UPI003F8DC5EA